MLKQTIYYFMSVVEEGSFSAAGKKWYLSQSAVSQQIAKIEKEYGFILFDRNAYRPTLTKQGEEFYRLCKKIQKSFDSELELIRQQNKKTVIGITGPFEKKHIPFIIREYKKISNTDIDIRVGGFQECIDNLKKNEFDIIFGLKNDLSEYKELEYTIIYNSHVCVLTSIDHPLATKKKITVNDIKDEGIISLSIKNGTFFYNDFMNAFKLDGVAPNIVKEVDNLNEYIMAIELGEGIGISAREIVSSNDNVVAIDLHDSHHNAQYAIAHLKSCTDNKILELYNYIIDYFRHYK